MKKHSPFLPFTGESALLYRYAEMTALEKKIPYLDLDAEYPEGLQVKHQLSLGYEFIAGAVYRLFFKGKMKFHTFIRYFTPFFFSTGIFAVFLIVKQFSTSVYEKSGQMILNAGAFLAALFYAVSLPAVIRSTGQEISRENYCLPLIFFHIFFMTKYFKGKGIIAALMAGIFLFVSLTFWEGAQVYFYVLAIFMALKFVLEKGKFEWLAGYAVVTAFASLAGVTIPYLRSHFFIISYPIIISTAIVLSGSFTKIIPRLTKRKYKTLLLAIFTVLIIFIASNALSGYDNTYSHMMSLLFYKLRFLNQKPIDPNLLPVQVRILWTPALTSPSGNGILSHFSTLLLLGSFSVVQSIIRIFRKGIETSEEFLLSNLLIFFLLYLMFRRIEVFLVFFICVLVGIWINRVVIYHRRKLLPVLSLVILCFLFESSKVYAGIDSMGRPVNYKCLKDLIEWVNRKTPQDSVILSHFAVSPPILTYTGRKIVLHPKFESSAMRKKFEDYMFALFSRSEDDFYSFCRKTGAQFLVYPRGTFPTRSLYSWRYMTATPRSDHNCNAYIFEYRPHCLRKFGLLYDNGKYMVYKIYRESDFESAFECLDRGAEYLEKKQYRDAIREYTECIRIYPQCEKAYWLLGTAYFSCGEREKAGTFWERARMMHRNPS